MSQVALGTLDRGLVGYWAFDAGLGSSVNDRSAYHNNGTWSGAAAYASGRFGVAASFGGNSFIDTGSAQSLKVKLVTAVAWIFMLSSHNDMSIIGYGNGLNGSGFCLNVGSVYGSGGNISANFAANDTTGVNGVVNLPLNMWHFIAGMYDGTRLYIHINGLLRASKTSSSSGLLSYSSTTNQIGQRNSNAFTRYVGLIEYCRLYNRILSVNELNALYQVRPLLPFYASR